jgi:hypothetical protein
MGKYCPLEVVPKKFEYHNIFSKAKFKSVLEFCLCKDHGCDVKLVEQLLAGALAAVELDCIADMESEELETEFTSQHYLEYVEIANEVIQVISEDVTYDAGYNGETDTLTVTESVSLSGFDMEYTFEFTRK